MQRFVVLLPLVSLLAPLDAQTLGLATHVVDPLHNFVRATLPGASAEQHLPIGLIAFPANIEAVPSPLSAFRASLSLAQTAGPRALIANAEVTSGGASPSQPISIAECSLRTLLTTAVPARVRLDVLPSRTIVALPFWPGHDTSVDIGGDGTAEYEDHFQFAPPLPATFAILADTRPTVVDWRMYTVTSGNVGGLQTQLELRFAEPAFEPTYGSPCGGELGGQLVPGQPFSRVLVASFPATASLAWFVGGAQQAQTFVPGFACPLLTETAIVIGAPLVNGANGRRFAELDLALPPVPGLTWVAQGIAFDGATFVGTNGVRLRT
jgi:hypothetical protein